MTLVLVIVGQVLGHHLQAVDATGYLGGIVGVRGGPAPGSAKRPLTRRIVNFDARVLDYQVLSVQRVCRTWPWS